MNRSIAKAAIFGTITCTISQYSFAATTPPRSLVPPGLSGTFQIGSTILANPGQWSGDHPITFAYKYQPVRLHKDCVPVCSPMGRAACCCHRRQANQSDGYSNQSPTAKRRVASQLTPVIQAYPNTAPPLLNCLMARPDPVAAVT